MGPPPFGDGNTVICRGEGQLLFRASMGPPPFGDGNGGEVQALLSFSHGFNGATAFRRWKLHPVLPDSHPLWQASMGPPPFGDGNSTSTSTSTPTAAIAGFNGATAFRRWKPEQVPPTGDIVSAASMGPPPFGDGNRRMRCGVSRARKPASMGPPPFGDGNHPGVVVGPVVPGLASMGPPPFGDGNVSLRLHRSTS